VSRIEHDEAARDVGARASICVLPVGLIELGFEQRASPFDKSGPLAEQPVIEGDRDAVEFL